MWRVSKNLLSSFLLVIHKIFFPSLRFIDHEVLLTELKILLADLKLWVFYGRMYNVDSLSSERRSMEERKKILLLLKIPSKQQCVPHVVLQHRTSIYHGCTFHADLQEQEGIRGIYNDDYETV